MFSFNTNCPEFQSDLFDEIRLFFPYDDAPEISHSFVVEDGIAKSKISIGEKNFHFSSAIENSNDAIVQKRLIKRACKLAMYRALSSYCNANPPWGSLTGIRPSKLVYDMLGEGLTLEQSRTELKSRYFVSDAKSDLICDIVSNQRGYYYRDDKLFNLYVHIPFCTSKCSYCSFTTQLLHKSKDVVSKYIERLRAEIISAVEFIERTGRLCSVYVGGGTPTALEADELFSLLHGFPFRDVEFTVEAGRPDTITKEKLDAIKSVGASRICVNPQSLNDETLRTIGRAHSAEDFYEKFTLARNYDFDINVDTIAGLASETADDFAKTLDGVLDLRPENITVHTLSRKNGSELKQQGRYDNCEIGKMTDYALKKLSENGYLPYYLYRQKQMLGNLENVGYCLPGKQCVNNITTMEDSMSVIACGAGAISKAVFNGEGRIERFAALRDVKLYLDRFDEKQKDKEEFLSKLSFSGK